MENEVRNEGFVSEDNVNEKVMDDKIANKDVMNENVLNDEVAKNESQTNEQNIEDVRVEKSSCCKGNDKRPKCIWNTIGFIVLFIAVIVLFVLFFTSKSGNTVKNAALQEKMESGEVPYMLTVNNDSIVANYVLVKILSDDLEEETERYQKELQTKQATFEEKYKNYQINVQNQVLTKTQMENAEVQLTKEAQDLKALQEKYTMILANKQASVQKEIADSIIAVTGRINDANYHAKYVLATAEGSAIVYNRPEYDITDEVIAELNRSYEKNHKTNE